MAGRKTRTTRKAVLTPRAPLYTSLIVVLSVDDVFNGRYALRRYRITCALGLSDVGTLPFSMTMRSFSQFAVIFSTVCSPDELAKANQELIGFFKKKQPETVIFPM
jgi:hypothetical protein